MTLIAGQQITLHLIDNTNTLLEIGGLDNVSMELSRAVHDTAQVHDTSWRQLRAASGSTSLRITASGVFSSHNAEDSLRVYAFNGQALPMQLHFGNSDQLSGDFIITRFIRSGRQDHSPAQFSLIAESAGDVSYG